MIYKLEARKGSRIVKEYFLRLEGLINFVKDRDLIVLAIQPISVEQFIAEGD